MGKAQRSAQNGNYGEAYQQAVQAWQAVRGIAAGDPEARQLEAELHNLLEQYGEAGNKKYSGKLPGVDKPLIIK